MKLKLSFLVLTLALLSVNAYAFQISDSQYTGEYNGVSLAATETAFNSVSARGNSGVELGAIIAVPSHAIGKYTLENGWLPCNGVAEMAGTELCTQNPTMCGKTPDLTKRFLEGTGGNSQMVEAGLPNIKARAESANLGHMDYQFWGDPVRYSGAFYADNMWGQNGTTDCCGHMGSWPRNLVLDASRSSAVYRNDVTTVQPASYTVHYFIRVNE